VSKLQKTAGAVLIVLLAAAGYGLWATHAPPVTSVQHLRTSASAPASAASEWRRASRGQRGVGFTAQPGIAVRPAAGGVEIAVRYVTRASERLALRARLYQSAVQLLAAPAVHPARA
jgi:hypothetical protein